MKSKGYITVPEAAQKAGISVPRIYALLDENKIDSARFGTRRFVNLHKFKHVLQKGKHMIPMFVTALLVAVIAGIFLRSALHALLLVGLVIGVFFVSCYAFNISPRVILVEGVHAMRHEARSVVHAHKREIREWL
jgi:excisionase family DNA binding protein